MKSTTLTLSLLFAFLLIETGCGGLPPIIKAASTGDTTSMSRMIADDTGIVNRSNFSTLYMTPLASARDASTAAWLIAHGADVNFVLDNGATAIWFVAGRSVPSADIIELYVKHGANVMTQQTKGYGTVEEYDNQGIHMTVFVDGIDNARLILTHATALHVAAISGDSENAIALINRGANIKQIEGSGYTPLHLACITMNYGVAKVLVDHGAEINVSDGQDETPLRACLNSKSTRDKTALIAFLRQRGGHE